MHLLPLCSRKTEHTISQTSHLAESGASWRPEQLKHKKHCVREHANRNAADIGDRPQWAGNGGTGLYKIVPEMEIDLRRPPAFLYVSRKYYFAHVTLKY